MTGDLDQQPAKDDHESGEDDPALFETVRHGQDAHSDDRVCESYHRSDHFEVQCSARLAI